MEKDETEIKESIKFKCYAIKDDKFELQEYMKDKSLHNVRDLFRIKTGMNKLRGNFPNCRVEGVWLVWGVEPLLR